MTRSRSSGSSGAPSASSAPRSRTRSDGAAGAKWGLLGFDPSGHWRRFLRDAHPPRFRAPDGVDVTAVEPGDSASFGATAAFGLGLPARTEAAFAALPGKPGWRCYVTRAGRAPAAAATFTDGPIALLAVDATAEAGRRSPSRAALLHRVIEDSIEAGARLICARIDVDAEGSSDADRRAAPRGLREVLPVPALGRRGISRELMRDFLRAEAGGGLALVLGSVAALLWVNVIDAGGYASFWATHINIGIGTASIDESLGHWVNDGLMTLFFFLISLEIKRELVTGELRHPKRAALPIIAALGGVVTPIAIFLAITGGHDAAGWGIPMATDAAFAIGVLALLGDRVGVGVKLFLVTIAVVDDVAAILVIAVAYTDHLSLGWLALALAGLAAVVAVRLLGVRRILVYVPLGLFVWVATFESGIHATLAGVALALITPAVPVGGRDVLGEIEHALHPWVNFAILPLFALANAGVKLGGGELSDPDGRRIALAVALGLVVGKFIGIVGATLGSAEAPPRRPPLGSRHPRPPRRRRPRRHRLHRLPLHHPARLRRPPAGRRRQARHPRRLRRLRRDRHRDLPRRRDPPEPRSGRRTRRRRPTLLGFGFTSVKT